MRRIGIVVVAWAAVVVAASAMTWRVIDTAGRQILAEPYQPAATSEAGEIGKPASTTRPEPTSTPTKKPDKKPTKKPTGGSTPTGNPSSSTPTKSPTTEPAASPVTRTWKGAAGSMDVQCTGSSMRLISASPNNGYRAEMEGQTKSTVAVHYEPKTDSGTEITVVARCVSGTPQFQVQADDS